MFVLVMFMWLTDAIFLLILLSTSTQATCFKPRTITMFEPVHTTILCDILVTHSSPTDFFHF